MRTVSRKLIRRVLIFKLKNMLKELKESREILKKEMEKGASPPHATVDLINVTVLKIKRDLLKKAQLSWFYYPRGHFLPGTSFFKTGVRTQNFEVLIIASNAIMFRPVISVYLSGYTFSEALITLQILEEVIKELQSRVGIYQPQDRVAFEPPF